MAIFVGLAGDFQREKAISRRLRAAKWLVVFGAVAEFCLGWASGFVWGRSPWSVILVALACAITLPAIRFFLRFADEQIRLARLEEDGADGERDFVKYLKELPDTYTVISDLDFAESYGNIDHLIVGPKGVFAVDVKNWRGTVTPDGKGELLLNGRPTDKPQVRYFTRRTMDLKDRIRALTKLDPYVQCVFAFSRTRVDANWGTTGSVHCIRAEQIADYVTKGRGGKPLLPADIPRIVSAAKALRELAQGARAQRSEAKDGTFSGTPQV